MNAQLQRLDFIEQLAASDMAACCGCAYYWEDPLAGVRAWGNCRRWPPGDTGDKVQPYDSMAVDYNWVCGEFARGCHGAIVAQRAKWRQELERAGD